MIATASAHLLARLVVDLHIHVAPLTCHPSSTMHASREVDFAAASHEETLGSVGAEGLQCRREEYGRVEVRVDVDVTVKVGDRAISSAL